MTTKGKTLDLTNVDLNFESAEDFAKALETTEEGSSEIQEVDDFESMINNEEDVDDVDDDEKEESSEEGESVSTDDLISSFAEELFSQGVLPDLDDKAVKSIKDFDSLKLAVQSQLEASFDAWKNDYKQDILNNLVAEGIIEKSDIKIDMENKIYKESDLEDEDTAKVMLKEYYKMSGLSDKRIAKLIENSVDVIDDAKDVLPEYKEMKEKKQLDVNKVLEEREKQLIKQREEAEKAIEKNVMDVEAFIPGQKIDRNFKQKVLKQIPNTVEKLQENWAKYLPILGYLDAYGILDGDFSKVTKVTETKAVNTFMDKLNAKKQSEKKELKYFRNK